MGLVTVERRGGIAVMTYANPPFGTMTAAGAQEMLDAFRPLSADPTVRSVIITGGLPGISSATMTSTNCLSWANGLRTLPCRHRRTCRPRTGIWR